jgi:beta-N-acetylhexosaminidase
MPGRPLPRALIALIALVAFAASCAAVPAVASAPPAELTARQLAGLRIVTGFHGRMIPAQLREMITAGDVSGVVLFSENVGGAADVQALTRQLQSIPRPVAVDEPLLVMADQEGGLVRRLPGKPRVSAQTAGAKGAAFAAKLGSQTGAGMAAMGVNVNLAPVLDVGRSGRAIDSEHRAWGRSAAAVKKTAIPFALGLQGAGVAATAKHFPGLGLAKVNTDTKVQKIRVSAAKLRRVDEAPFRAFAARGGQMVMLGTAIYPALSPRPAALARPIATGELRTRLGFSGVSITDALGTASGKAFGDTPKLALAAAGAGTDMLLFSDIGQAATAGAALRGALDSGADRAPFEVSAGRILALRASRPPLR